MRVHRTNSFTWPLSLSLPQQIISETVYERVEEMKGEERRFK
jgi:hypothetical protein